MEIFNCEQGTPEWFAARAGIPTASMFGTVLAKGEGKTRLSYMIKLAGEIISGQPMESFSNEHTERGNEEESIARDLYAFQTGVQYERVGFIRDGRSGASPDCLIGDDGGAEIKSRLVHIQTELFAKGELPSAVKPQIQGLMWKSRRRWWDYVSYCSKMPAPYRLFILRVSRDESYIQKLATEIDRFNADLDAMVAQIRARGERVAA